MAQKKAGKTGGEPKERRRKYGSPEELQKKIDAYFDDCDLEGRLYGEAGLARYFPEQAAAIWRVSRSD